MDAGPPEWIHVCRTSPNPRQPRCSASKVSVWRREGHGLRSVGDSRLAIVIHSLCTEPSLAYSQTYPQPCAYPHGVAVGRTR